MKAWIVGITVLVGAMAARAGEVAATQGAVSNTTYSQRVLEISPQGEVNRREVRDALREFTLREGKMQLGVEGLELGIVGEGDYAFNGRRPPGPMITLDLPDNAPKKAAKELMDQIVKELERVLVQQHEKRIKEWTKLTQSQAELERRIRDAENLAAELRSQAGMVAGQADPSQEAVRAAMSKLEQERQTLAIDLAGMDARREALEKTIAEQSKKMEDRVAVDPIRQELQKVVDAKAEHLARIKKLVETGQAAMSEVTNATAALAEVRAKLLEREEVVAQRAGGDVLAGWNKELLNLSIDRAEKSAKAKFIEQELQPYRKAGDMLRKAVEVDSEVRKLRRELGEVSERLAVKFPRPFREDAAKPSVTVKHAEDRPGEAKPGQGGGGATGR